MAKLIWNKKKFYDRIEKQFLDTMTIVANEMQDQIIEERRVYPNATVRKVGAGVTGKYADSPRDVVDRGELRDTFEIIFQYQGMKVTLIAKWSAKHGEYIYYGTDKQPPYEWVKIALRRLNLRAEFKKHGTAN